MSNWIKCSDRLPAIDGEYLVFTKNEDNKIAICVFEYGRWNLKLYETDYGDWVYLAEIQGDITHWQNLPTKPI